MYDVPMISSLAAQDIIFGVLVGERRGMLVGNTAGCSCMTWQEPGWCLNEIMLSGTGGSPWKVAFCDAEKFNYQYTMLEDTSNSP